ncbi:MAG: hypothetical protein VB088_14325 [Sphaerochaeta sp.]|nr:hypothetical protein [Sphaerochaeta sp.]
MDKAIPPKGYTSLHEGKVHGVRQYEVTSQFANRGFTLHTGNIN